jgi:N-acetylated-alpha-linked acidic dipeptidase
MEVGGNAAGATRADLQLAPLGSGSDYTPFLQHLGVASLNLDFGGHDQYGQYHSIYDSFDHFVRFMDPELAYLATSAKLTGRVVLRLAEAEVLPFTLDRAAAAIGEYAGELERLEERLRTEAEERTRLLAERAHELSADLAERIGPPAPLDRVPVLERAPLENSVRLFAEAARSFDAARATAVETGLPAELGAELNGFLRGFERRLTRAEGLPGRPWYRHQIYAPGLYTGYGVKTLPAVREAIEQRDWDGANREYRALAELLDAARAATEELTAKLAAVSASRAR